MRAESPRAFRYTGRRYDAETGLYYYRARYYSPTLGRFNQTDAVGYGSDLYLYAYVYNDPFNRADPSGETGELVAAGCAISAEVGCAPGAVIGGLIEGVIYVGSAVYVAYKANQVLNEAEGQPKTDESKKGPPNPNGSKGGEAHQDKIKERIQELKDQGHIHAAGGDKPEETVDTSGGNKESRRPDITTAIPTANLIVRMLVVRTRMEHLLAAKGRRRKTSRMQLANAHSRRTTANDQTTQ